MPLAALLLVGAALAVGSGRAAPPPAFRAVVSPVRWTDLRFSWRPGCPVPPAHLRLVRVAYRDFHGDTREGRLVVHRAAARDVVAVFRRLYRARFPIRRMAPVSAYRGSDAASMAADNTSAFNCRRVAGTRRWSMHAYGLAIDVNPVENPYVLDDRVRPPAGRRFLDRSPYRPGMAVESGVVVEAFASVGWEWGGRWSWPDYQHFSAGGG